MQTSTGTFFRAVVMVICLVLIPIAALFGDKVRDTAKDYVVEQWRVLAEKWGGTPSTPAPSVTPPPVVAQADAMQNASGGPEAFAPRWPDEQPGAVGGPMGTLPSGGASPLATYPAGPPAARGMESGLSSLPPGASSPGAFAANTLPPGPSSGSSGTLAANYEEPVAAVPDWPGQAARGVAGGNSSPQAGGFATPNTLPPAAGLTPSAGLPSAPPAVLGTGVPGGSAALGSEASPLPGSSSPGMEDRLRQYQNRLRELGVVYYLLETWGDRGQVFRFYCRVGLAGNTTCTQYFQAVDAEPLMAMAKVIQQVENWRAGGQ